MIKVQSVGQVREIQNPVTKQWKKMRTVTFIETGREGADKGMSETTAFLSSIVGHNVGLEQIRVHTHPIAVEDIPFFEQILRDDKELPGHINREMHTTPQMHQQEGVQARLIDGKPTYFKTFIGGQPVDDVDKRISNEVLVSVNPSYVFNARIGGTEVRMLEQEMDLSTLSETA